jgi:hypothetical protein
LLKPRQRIRFDLIPRDDIPWVPLVLSHPTIQFVSLRIAEVRISRLGGDAIPYLMH